MELGISDNHPQFSTVEEPSVEEMEGVLNIDGDFYYDKSGSVYYAGIKVKRANCEWLLKQSGHSYSDAIRRLYRDYFTIKNSLSPVAAELLYGNQETTEAPF